MSVYNSANLSLWKYVKEQLREKEDPTVLQNGTSALHIISKYGDLSEVMPSSTAFNVDLKEVTSQGRTPLMYAVIHNRLDNAKWLISHNADVNAVSKSGLTAIDYIAEYDLVVNVDMLRLLINSGAKRWEAKVAKHRLGALLIKLRKESDAEKERALMQGDKQTCTVFNSIQSEVPLHQLAKHCDLESCLNYSDLVREFEVNEMKQCTSLLHEAVLFDRLSNVHYLIKEKVDINTLNSEKETPLHLAVTHNNVDIINTLVNNGADTNIANSSGEYPIHVAARYGNPTIVKLLVENGAKLDIMDSEGNLPLHISVLEGREDVAKYLINKGSPLDKKNNSGAAVMQLAVEKHRSSIIKALVAQQCDVDVANEDRNTGLYYAVRSEDEDITRILLEAKASIDLQNQQKETVLHLSVCRGEDLTRLLLNYKPDVNMQDIHGQTPLHISTAQHKATTVQDLLNAGADPNAVNKRGESALDFAERASIMRILVNHGAIKWRKGNRRKDNFLDDLLEKTDTEQNAVVETTHSDKGACRVCRNTDYNTLLLPCNHVCVCTDCSIKVTNCPLCRQLIKSRLTVHVA